MEELNLKKILEKLSKERPIFYSEADFQFALGWKIKEEYPNAEIRFEYCVSTKENTKIYVDILVRMNNKKYPIELKYKTAKYETKFNGDEFELKNQGAQDCGRYDLWKDVSRIENLEATRCFSIFLTNDPAYWKNYSRHGTVDQDFCLADKTCKHGTLEWRKKASEGTTKNRTAKIVLENEYDINWQDYSIIPEIESDKKKLNFFRYIILSCENKINN